MTISTAQPPISFIALVLCNKLYIGESGRKLGDRFREHLLDVKNKGSDLSKPVARHFIFRAIRTNTWKSVEFTYTLGTMKPKKERTETNFKLGTLFPTESMNDYSFAY